MHIAQHEAFVQNAQNPVLSGASQMPELPKEQSVQMQNLPPSMTGAANQGLSSGQESGIVGAS